MEKRKLTVAGAVAGTVLGAGGLVWLGVPAGASQSPALPEVSAEDLIESVLTVQPQALGGTVQVENDLGLPSIPGLELPAGVGAGTSRAQVWSDGGERFRLAVRHRGGEDVLVGDGRNIWSWNSEERTATRDDIGGADRATEGHPELAESDPASVAAELTALLREDSGVAVDGTAEVAGRAAYELVLAPSPEQRSLVREVRIAVDGDTRMPLRVSVLANGTETPAFQVGFTELDLGEQDESLFEFDPPAGSLVEERDAEAPAEDAPHALPEGVDPAEVTPTLHGAGWESVVIAQSPVGLSPDDLRDTLDGIDTDEWDEDELAGMDPADLLDQVGERVTGEWGEGYLVETSLLTVLLVEDGRVAAGAVPAQVLTEALAAQR
ncbi:LolA family protein [Actinoalloteichus caeruleus]|uniref:LolA family protein n=1 Tax=Actinoalloteichus cyanogriseus TaxID=2893586 RepID=UPI003BB9740F